jgi:hypothetical protein
MHKLYSGQLGTSSRIWRVAVNERNGDEGGDDPASSTVQERS